MASRIGMWWQKSRLRSWWMKTRSGLGWLWQKIRQHPFIAIGILVLLIACIAFALAVHWLGGDWTGFNRYIGPELRPNQQYRPEKTLWDWLQLLIVPLVLAVGGFWLSQMQKTTEQWSTTDNQREAALQSYIDKISELLLKEHLDDRAVDGKLKPEYEQVRKIARVRTVTVLTQLDTKRVDSIFTFLREAGLMSTTSNSSVVSLNDANLGKVKWERAYLSRANLSGADLYGADLSEAYLSRANLSGTILYTADLSKATLMGANLRRAGLYRADLNNAHLGEADLRYADLLCADLRRAYLWGANLRGANLSKANLRGAHLIEANLRGAELRGADLSGAGFHRADLNGAIVTEEQLKTARSLQGATMPDGSKHP